MCWWKMKENSWELCFYTFQINLLARWVWKMFSSTNANAIEVNNSNDVEIPQWNSTHTRSYAAHFPYTILDESFLKHLLNFTMAKSELIRSNNNSGFKHNHDNDTMNYECSLSHDTESAWFSMEFQATLHFMYITILVIAIFGNGIVCFIVCTSSRMQTVTNFFIANLALSDMLMAFFCIPFSFISLFVLQWVDFISWGEGESNCLGERRNNSTSVNIFSIKIFKFDEYLVIEENFLEVSSAIIPRAITCSFAL